MFHTLALWVPQIIVRIMLESWNFVLTKEEGERETNLKQIVAVIK